MQRNGAPKCPWLRWAVIAIGIGVGANCLGQVAMVSATPTADAFVWSSAPANNYGAAGALSVSGSAAVNGVGQQNGLFDTLIRFALADVAASFNGSLGTNEWVVTGATLVLNEVGAPNNSVFNRGVGAFEVRWIASDSWVEGSGTPMAPTTVGVVYDDLGSVLNSAADTTLGWFTNGGVSGTISFPLELAGPLVSDIVAGADVNLYLTAAGASVGFTFNSRNFSSAGAWPSLQVSAVAKPLPTISSIRRTGSNQVSIRFNTVSNWTFTVQGADGLPAVNWSNLFTVPAKPFDDQATFVDTVTNRVRFYRLLISQ